MDGDSCFRYVGDTFHMTSQNASSLFAVFLLFILASAAVAAPFGTVQTDQSDVIMSVERGYTHLALDGGRVLAEPGEPELPARVLSFVIPSDMRVSDLRVSGSGEVVLDGQWQLFPSQPEVPIGEPAGEWVPPRDSVYGADGVYPVERCTVLGEGFLGGYRIATVAVHPLRWRPSSGELLLSEELTVELVLEPAADRPRTRERVTESSYRLYRDVVAGMVANPGDLGAVRGGVDVQTVGGSFGFSPRHTPSLEGTPVEYVIITSDDLASYFEPFAAAKTARGIPTVIKTLSWIDANYPGGCDQAERIRFFIQDAYESWGTAYVLLGGDTGVIPVRMAYTRYYGGNSIPCDLYYSDLDGNWNADGDELFGEGYSGETLPGDDVDLYSDVFVGRAPVNNVVDVQNFIAKCDAYAETPLLHFTDRSLYLAEVLFPYDWSSGAFSLDGASDIIEPGLPFVDPGIHNARLYANLSPYPDAHPLDEIAAVDSLDLGYNIVVHVGHGNKDVMRVGLDNYVGLSDISSLSNGLNASGFWWLLNCTSTAIDYDCIAERALRNTAGGASGLIGPTRYAFPSTGREYYWDWLTLMYQGEILEAGPLFAATRAVHASFDESGRDNTDRWTQLSLVLLGDPEQRIWSARPRALTVSHPGAVQVGESGATVTVTDPGPVEGARVCIASPNGEIYAAGITNASGVANLWFTPVDVGVLTVSATAPNYSIYESTINVTIASGAHVYVDDIIAHDGASGMSAGNGNGVVESGETIELDLAVRNAGIAAATGLTVDAATADPHVTLEQATASVGDVPANGSADVLSALRFLVAPDCPNEWDAEFALTFTDAARATWSDTIRVRLFAPEPRVARTVLDDSVGGDGDGTAEWGETVSLLVEMQNEGNGSAEGLTGVIRYPAPAEIVVIDSLESWGTVPAGGSAAGTIGFTVDIPGHVHNVFELEYTDAYGMTWTAAMDIARPEAPDSLWGRVKGTTIQLYWNQSESADIRGYDIMRSDAEAGPYVTVNTAIIENAAYFADSGLDENTRYFYRVTAVDSSGLASLGGQTLTISTNPPSQAGWPLTTNGGVYSSVAVTDLDGDGVKDIVVASDELYAWRGDGSEFLDGDGDPRSDGVYAIDGTGGYRCSPAIGEVDGDPDLEIVAAAWTNVGTDLNPVYEVFVWNAEDGTVASGWPAVTKRFCWASPVLADLDNDGRSEVIIPCADGKIYCWRYDGSEFLDGDDNPLTTGVFADLVDQYVYSSPAVADIDGDGAPEILQAASHESLYCFEVDGTRTPGWPVNIEFKAYSSPAVGDVDGDGDLEIAISSKAWKTWIFDHEGNELDGWPKVVESNGDFPPSPVFADVTDDGELELIQVSSTGSIWVWDYDGNAFPGWPQQLGSNTKSSPAVADVDDDPDLEIVVGCDDGKLYAFDIDGSLLNGWPIQTDAEIYGSPSVDDLDGDGDNEVLVGGMDTNVYMWDTPGDYDDGDGVEWGMFLHDTWRTQFYGFTEPVAVPDEPETPEPVNTLVLDQNRPNPFNPVTEIAYNIPGGDGGRVTLSIYAIDGSLVTTLVDELRDAGPGTATWDGLDARGRRVASGVYLYRISAAGETVARKMVLLK